MDNNQDTQQNQQSQNDTLTTNLAQRRLEWTKKIEDLNSQMKNLPNIDNLLNTIYTERQNAVDTYYGTYAIYKKQIIAYKQSYANLYNSIKMGQNGIRYSSESSITTQVEAGLSEQQEILDELKTFIDYLWETIKTIDGLIFATKTKIEISKILNGIKF